MYPGRNNDRLFCLVCLEIPFFCNCEHIAIQSCDSFAQYFPAHECPSSLVSLYFMKVHLTILVGVRECICKVHCIIIVLKLVVKREGIVALTIVLQTLSDSI